MKKIIFDGNKNVVSGKIREYRTKRGLSQQELAAKMQTMGVNLDQQMISKIEHNARFVSDYELGCFCLVLDIPSDALLSDFYEKYGG